MVCILPTIPLSNTGHRAYEDPGHPFTLPTLVRCRLTCGKRSNTVCISARPSHRPPVTHLPTRVFPHDSHLPFTSTSSLYARGTVRISPRRRQGPNPALPYCPAPSHSGHTFIYTSPIRALARGLPVFLRCSLVVIKVDVLTQMGSLSLNL